MNRDLNDNEAEYVFGGAVERENLPDKFKPIKPQEEEELTEKALESVRGDNLPLDELPKGSYISKEQELETRGPGISK